MDIRINGEMDGIEAAAVIRSQFNIPVIFSTAYLDDERIERAKITMPFGYLLKPVHERDLKVTIEMALYVAKVEAERKRAEKKIEHHNRVLRAVRNVNQLITKEKDLHRLIQGACDNLIETRWYHNAWIALLDESGDLKTTAEAGLGDDFLPMVEQLNRGELTACVKRTLAKPRIVVIPDPAISCTDCPLSMKYAGRGAMTVQLRHGSKIYGILAVSIKADFAVDEEEQGLFQEVAEDIAFALNKIKAEKNFYRLKEITAIIPHPIALISQDYHYLAVNQTCSDHSGIDMEQMIGQPVADFLGQTLFEATIKPNLDRCLAGEILNFEAQIDFPIKGKCWMELQYFPYRDIGGKVKGVISYGIDIADRKQEEETIKASLKEKESLVQEIHHRVKNNLQIMSSLLELQISSVDDNRIKETIKEFQGRIFAMSLIHENLHESEDMSEIDLKSYVSTILISLLQAYQTNSDRVQFKIDFDKIKLGVAKASPLGLILNELITNALKYAFPDDRQGEIVLKLKSSRENEVELTISDNGIGMPEGFSLQDTDSLGLKLVKIITEGQLNGSVDMENKTGTKFIIKFNPDK